ncbi:MAG: ATP synthase F1 subunit epsilon [Candidatus Pacebacteria bacterium]|nr:ATP synthase F1 subunit epsilon [Candidatus Paceibacterota bacterium]MCD8508270.1 ATP synthase F1 subunit epsilon [Candidatus Paceibacterota bacterium]MCD8527746.1 ATP synthase F1 subunit epsilon [Candidatus Paceibacterota bacterium]MCD8563496.1 ATP synthase F1 subunit epsilon [Candidatus Paceibacterota bacterium]
MSVFNFKISTPDRVVYHDDVEQVSIPTAAGEITILPHHAPLVSIIQSGEMRIVKNGNTLPLVCDRGVLEIRADGTVAVLADTAEAIEDIDADVAQAAYDRARAYMQEKQNVADVEFAAMQAMLESNLARINAIKKWRK